MKVGDTVTMKGISQHGRNRIREHGDAFVVVATSSSIQAFPQLGTRVSGFKIKSVATGYTRWVAASGDPHMETAT